MSNMQKAEKLRKDFEEAFGGKMTFMQLWFVVKCCKVARKFARSNAAFNNLFNEIFRGVAVFSQVDKVVPDYKNPGETRVIKSLLIKMKLPDGEVQELDSDSSGDEE